jgi:hypothetical protein
MYILNGISLVLTSLRQFDHVFMFGEDVHVNECNIFLSRSTISHSYYYYYYYYYYLVKLANR